ncbi:thiol:disulfide interchange protein DsbG [Acinetobacter sp. ANC 4558]|uniref:thiol:disulfide interchange protein DsbG n=1 Tax=Acinetobacter sp. ANC 4558 TaxID=1977876 RepID=UPI000B766260|nr:thiol:disulfide interchange protein DsbG [Acinetobacter sp. ANC 4558]OTG85465.1 thiol:disulfide interchange protein DsbG [Acinetobacter sp. ANC 4558]
MNAFKHGILTSILFTLSMTAHADIKEQIKKEGFEFVKQIPAPSGMTAWAGHTNQHPGTVFISNDQQYYIIGDLYNAKGENLSIDAINTHVKDIVLDEVWKSLEKSTWIQDGEKSAPRIIYVFSDPNCPYCYQFWQQARPWIKSGKVQLRHIQVGVIREESRAQVATLLMSKNPEKLFNEINDHHGKSHLEKTAQIPKDIADKIDFNQSLMEKYGFFSTPSMIWKDQKGNLRSTQGVTKNPKEIFEE